MFANIVLLLIFAIAFGCEDYCVACSCADVCVICVVSHVSVISLFSWISVIGINLIYVCIAVWLCAIYKTTGTCNLYRVYYLNRRMVRHADASHTAFHVPVVTTAPVPEINNNLSYSVETYHPEPAQAVI